MCKSTICPHTHVDKPQGHPELFLTQLKLAACSFPPFQGEWRLELGTWALRD